MKALQRVVFVKVVRQNGLQKYLLKNIQNLRINGQFIVHFNFLGILGLQNP